MSPGNTLPSQFPPEEEVESTLIPSHTARSQLGRSFHNSEKIIQSRQFTESHVTRYDPERGTLDPDLSTVAMNQTQFVTVQDTLEAQQPAPKKHSQMAVRLDSSVQAMVEKQLLPCYQGLKEDTKAYHVYIRLKWYSCQGVDERDIRYHRVLGIGAFGTVNGCIVIPLGCMLAMKSMDKKRIKKKRAKSQVVAERMVRWIYVLEW